jgi:hypothetical protein
MGMIGHVRQVTPSELQGLQRQPEGVEQLLHGKALANAGNIRSALARVSQLARQARSSEATDPAELEKTRAEILQELQSAGVKLPGEGADEEGLSLEKSWHILHYLLTGTTEEAPPPLGYAILGGSPIGGDLGYGPARFLFPEQVRDVAAALGELTPEDLAQRFDLDAMSAANVYPSADEDELEMAQHYFNKLVQYYADAAAKGNAMLLWID